MVYTGHRFESVGRLSNVLLRGWCFVNIDIGVLKDYVEKGYSGEKIARIVGMSHRGMSDKLRKLGLRTNGIRG